MSVVSASLHDVGGDARVRIRTILFDLIPDPAKDMSHAEEAEEAENCLRNPCFSLLPLLPLRENLQLGNACCIRGFGMIRASCASQGVHAGQTVRAPARRRPGRRT